MMRAIDVFQGTAHYERLLQSFYEPSDEERLDVREANTSIAIYYHLCRMRLAEWKMRVHFHRHKRHSFSEIFQDLIAFYLLRSLPDGFRVELERRDKNSGLQPDILLEHGGHPRFVIEVKTTIGWDRGGLENRYEERINQLSNAFGVPRESVIFVFESVKNVGRWFEDIYWDREDEAPKARPLGLPFAGIFPLYYQSADPFYWNHESGFNEDVETQEYSDDALILMAGKNIIYPFEEIVEKISDLVV